MAKVVAAMRMRRTEKGKARGSMFSCFLENVFSPMFLVIQGREIYVYIQKHMETVFSIIICVNNSLNRHLWGH